jgi:nucleoside 2-deoxyribosyltransferase
MPLRPTCYVASPLGFTEAGRAYYREVYIPALAEVVEPVDPWSWVSSEDLSKAAAAGRERELLLSIGRQNIEAIRRCSVLVAYLDGQELDSGTAAELGFAVGSGLHCFGLRTDIREHGEAGTIVNLQVESFILESGGRICASLEALVGALATATYPGPRQTRRSDTD